MFARSYYYQQIVQSTAINIKVSNLPKSRMANTFNIQSDMSLSLEMPNNNAETPVPAMGTVRSSRPTTIATQRTQDTAIARLSYPSDIPKYYLGMEIMSYRRNSLLEMGTTSTISSIALPLPQKLVDNHQIGYEQKSMGTATIGSAVNAGIDPVRNAVNGLAQGGSIRDAVSGVASQVNSNTGTNAAVAAGVDGVNAIGPVGTAAQAALGYAPNYFLTVLLDGPKYKEHNLRWDFAPRSAQEAESLNRIIRVLNNSMAPGIGFGGAVFTFPRVFKLYYRPNARYLYKFKPAVLVGLVVDSSGGGVPSFRREDPKTNNKNPPTVVSISMTFLELEFWLRSDFGGDNDGAGGILPDDVFMYAGTGRNE